MAADRPPVGSAAPRTLCEPVHIRPTGCRLWFGHRRAIGDGGRSCHRPLGRFLPRLGPAGCHQRGLFRRRLLVVASPTTEQANAAVVTAAAKI